jgi:hypothetical protein
MTFATSSAGDPFSAIELEFAATFCIRAASSNDEYFSVVSLFMVLMLQQERMINELMPKCQNEKSAIVIIVTV